MTSLEYGHGYENRNGNGCMYRIHPEKLVEICNDTLENFEEEISKLMRSYANQLALGNLQASDEVRQNLHDTIDEKFEELYSFIYKKRKEKKDQGVTLAEAIKDPKVHNKIEERLNIFKLEDLKKFTRNDLLSIPNFGPKLLLQVEECMKKYDMELLM